MAGPLAAKLCSEDFQFLDGQLSVALYDGLPTARVSKPKQSSETLSIFLRWYSGRSDQKTEPALVLLGLEECHRQLPVKDWKSSEQSFAANGPAMIGGQIGQEAARGSFWPPLT